MKIHEYQAKAILARYGVPVQPGRVASTPEEAEAIAGEVTHLRSRWNTWEINVLRG